MSITESPNSKNGLIRPLKVKVLGVLLSGQFTEDVDPLFEFFFRGDITNTEMRIPLAENIARNDEDIIVDGFCDKRGGTGVFVRGLNEHIEGPARLSNFEAVAKFIQHSVPLNAVVVNITAHIFIEGRQDGHLKRGRRTDESVLLDHEHFLQQRSQFH